MNFRCRINCWKQRYWTARPALNMSNRSIKGFEFFRPKKQTIVIINFASEKYSLFVIWALSLTYFSNWSRIGYWFCVYVVIWTAIVGLLWRVHGNKKFETIEGERVDRLLTNSMGPRFNNSLFMSLRDICSVKCLAMSQNPDTTRFLPKFKDMFSKRLW